MVRHAVKKKVTWLDMLLALLFVTVMVSGLWLKHTGTEGTLRVWWWAFFFGFCALAYLDSYRGRDELERQITQKSAALAGLLTMVSMLGLLLWLPTHEKAQTAASTDWLYLLVFVYATVFVVASLTLRYAAGERPFWRQWRQE